MYVFFHQSRGQWERLFSTISPNQRFIVFFSVIEVCTQWYMYQTYMYQIQNIHHSILLTPALVSVLITFLSLPQVSMNKCLRRNTMSDSDPLLFKMNSSFIPLVHLPPLVSAFRKNREPSLWYISHVTFVTPLLNILTELTAYHVLPVPVACLCS